MNKKYNKPVIEFRSLATSAASTTCELISEFAEFSCPIMIPEWGETIFADIRVCDWTNDSGYICYHVPTAGSNVFSS